MLTVVDTLPQILEKVSPNPQETKSVAAQKNARKNRSMAFTPSIYMCYDTANMQVAQFAICGSVVMMYILP